MTVDDVRGSVVKRGVVCPHCRNQGMVVLDGENTGVACPMCTLGGYRNKRWFAPMVSSKGGGLQPAVVAEPGWWCWRPEDLPAGVSWERGLTVEHVCNCTRCGVRASRQGVLCDNCLVVVAV